MTYYKFAPEDVIDTILNTYPKHVVELNGDQVTGSIRLESQFLSATLETREYQGFSQKRGGRININGPFTASIDFKTAISGSTNHDLWSIISGNLYPYYNLINSNYSPTYTSSLSTTFRVVDIPSIYYDFAVLTGSFSASDLDSAGDARNVYDNGRGGLYSGSLSGTLVGNIFYNEGLAVLTKGDLSDFGGASSTNFKWKVTLKGTNNIPVKIFKCRAPAGELNASTNETFYQIPLTGDYKNQKEIVKNDNSVYITAVGLYNKQFELVAVAKLATPIKKKINENVLFRLKIDG